MMLCLEGAEGEAINRSESKSYEPSLRWPIPTTIPERSRRVYPRRRHECARLTARRKGAACRSYIEEETDGRFALGFAAIHKFIHTLSQRKWLKWRSLSRDRHSYGLRDTIDNVKASGR